MHCEMQSVVLSRGTTVIITLIRLKVKKRKECYGMTEKHGSAAVNQNHTMCIGMINEVCVRDAKFEPAFASLVWPSLPMIPTSVV